MEFFWDRVNRATWEAQADLACAPLQQRWDYGATVAELGGQVARLEVRQGGAPVAWAQFLRRKILGVEIALCLRGPLWADSPVDLWDALRPAARELGVRALIVAPNAAADLPRQGFTEVMTGAQVAMLDLTADAPDLLARMQGKWRNRLRHAQRAGIQVRKLTGAAACPDWLLQHENAQRRARGYRNLPPAFHRAWAGMHPRGLVCRVARDGDGRPMATMVFARHGTSATYQLGWSAPAGRAVSAHNLLLWQAMNGLKAGGVRMLDLGTLNTRDAPGLARFKLGSGAQPVQLGGSWFAWARRNNGAQLVRAA